MKKATRILVVDAEPAIRQTYSQVLRAEGYELWEAATGRQALELAREHLPDLVFVDASLPDLKGLEVCRQIKADAALQDLFVVLLFGEGAQPDHQAASVNSGADEYLIKSLSQDEFLVRLRTFLRLRDATIALRASEQHYQRLVELLPEAVTKIDLEGRIRTVNAQAAVILGCADPAELLNKNLIELIAPEQHQRARTEMATALEKGVMRNSEYSITRSSGERIPVELSFAAIKDDRGQPVGLVGVVRDITERRRVEESLRERGELNRATLRTAMEGFWRFDRSGNLVDVNETYCRLSGYSREELLSMNISEVSLNEPTATSVAQHIQRIIQLGSDRFETRHRSKDGRVIELEVSTTFLNLGPGYLVAFLRDITQRKREENRLLESEQRFRQLAENIREVFWMTNPDKNQMLYISPGYEEIWGRTCASLYAEPRNWLDALHPEDRERVLAAALTRQATGQYDEEYRIVRPSGSIRWIHDRAFPICDESGGVFRIAGIAEDITRRKRIEESLRSSEACTRSILHSALDAIITLDALGRVTDFNAAAEKIFGCPAFKSVGKRFAVFLPASLQLWFEKGIASSFVKPEGPVLEGRVEISARRANGVEFPAEFAITRVQGAGSPMFTVFVRDISAHRAAQAQLARLAHAVESTAELICITDLQDRFTFVNRAFEQAYGYASGEILGKTAEFLFSPANPPGLMAEILEQTRKGGWRGEVLDRRKDGREFPVFLSTSPVKDEYGHVVGLIGLAQDITERKRAERQTMAFSTLGHKLSAATTPSAASQLIMDVASELFEWDAGYIHLWSSAEDKIIPLLTMDRVGGRRVAVAAESFTPEPSALMRRVMAEGAQLINRTSRTPAPPNLVPFGDTTRLSASMMYAPIRSNEAVVGILSVQSYRPKAYSQEDVRLLKALADYCGDALQRIKVTEESRETEAKYRTIFENATEGIFQTTPGGRYLSANPALARMFGYSSPEEMITAVVDIERQTYVSPQRRKELELVLQTQGSVERFEAERYRKDGSRFWTMSHARAVRDPSGAILYYEGTIRDETERKRAEDQIRLLADAVQSTQEFISVTDSDNRFTFVNRAFLTAYHLSSEEEVLGQKPDFLYSAANPPGLCEEVFRQTLAGGWNGEILNCRKDGTEFPIALSTSRIRNREGETIGLVGVARDISERKRTEKQNAAFSLLGYRMSVASEPEQAANIILEIASDLFGWDVGYVHLYSQADDRIIRVLTVDTVEGQRTSVPEQRPTVEPSPLMRSVMKDGARLENRLPESSVAVELFPFGDTHRCSASMMYVPIHSGGAVQGLLSIQSYTPQAYSPADLNLLQTLADHCGDALHRIKLKSESREIEAKYRNIFENATEGIFQTTPEGRYLSANPALARMLGYQSSEELVSGVTDIERQTYVSPTRRSELKQLLETQGSVQQFEAERYRKDGSTFWISINSHAVRDASGAILYYEGTNQDITERKLAEEALREAEARYRSIFENATEGIFRTTREGRLLSANPALARMFRFASLPEMMASLTNIQTQVYVHPERRAELKRVLETDGTVEGFEAENYRKDGTKIWISLNGHAVRSKGVTLYYEGTIQDITERKWAEQLLKTERDFSIFLSSTNELSEAVERLLELALQSEGVDCGAVFLVNQESGVLNLAAHQGLSADFASLSAHLTADLVPSPPAARGLGSTSVPVGLMAEIVRQLRRESLQAVEIVPIQHSGQVVAVLTLGSHVSDEIPPHSCQAIEALAARAGGVIARIRVEQSLRANRQLLQQTLHNLRDAVFLVAADTLIIQECNPAATQIFGYARTELIGHTAVGLHLDAAGFEQFNRSLRAAVEKQGFLSDFESEMKRKDGTSFPTEHSVMPIEDDAGRIMNWVSVVRDITDRKRTEQELRLLSRRIIDAQETERMRVARELHDGVNQLLAAAKIRLGKVEEITAPLNPAAREILKRSEKLIVQALEENRRIAHNLRPTDLDELGLAAACQNFCRELQSRTKLAVKCNITPPGLRLPPAVELGLFRIVQEALNNVDKHAHARSVRVRLTCSGGAIRLKIQDDGRGIKLKSPGASRGKRQGIGLTNMRERAAALGGTCEVSSTPNQGTTISVCVPAPTPGSTG